MLQILAHRGYWKKEADKNSIEALTNALNRGWGIETDIRDYCGELVISHNPPDATSPKLETLLSVYQSLAHKPVLALNIKADGLYLLLPSILKRFGITNNDYFLFDTSLPEQYIYLKREYRIFTRSSEFEPQPAFIDESEGVWLDQFTNCGHMVASIDAFLKTGKMISVVSPELHGREHQELWEFLLQRKGYHNLYLCTDKSDEAEAYFQ